MAWTLNNLKADLTYKDLNELKNIVQKSLPSDDKLKNPKICNSLLKLYDEGKKSCALGEEEKAFILLMRFVDSSMKLKRLAKADKDFVESMLTNQIIKTSIEMLEKLQTSLTERYNERSLNGVKSILAKAKIGGGGDDEPPADAKIVLAPPSSSNGGDNHDDSARKFMTPVELVKFVENSVSASSREPKRLLIIDLRPQDDFDSSHIDLSLFLSKTKHSTQLDCINIPESLIEPVSWKIEKNLERFCQETGGGSSLAFEAFKARASFDQLILLDKKAGSAADSKVAILKRALHDFESEKILKSEPIILDGGWDQWLVFYPGCCKRSTGARKSLPGASSKSAEATKRSEHFYPDADLLAQRMDTIRSKPVEPKSNQAVDSPIPKASVNSAAPSFETPVIPNPAPRIEPAKPSPAPTIDRSKKPDLSSKTDRAEEPDESDRRPVSTNNPVEAPKQSPASTVEPNTEGNNKFEPVTDAYKPPAGPNQFSSRPPFKFEFNRANIVDSVYKPTGFQTTTPSNSQDKNFTKVLDNKTGLFAYVEQPPQPASTTTVNPAKNTQRPPVDPELKSNFKTSLNDTSERKASSKFEPSNLKRTISTPNIASLVDDEESPEPVLKPTTDSSDLTAVSKTARIPAVSTDVAKVPSVDRNRKPAPSVPPTTENSNLANNSYKNTLSAMAIDELQPVFAKDVKPGLTGLRNLGNTCFMNSIIQCLSNTRHLHNYFLTNAYAKDLNRSNKLGYRGEIADEFAVIIQSLWRGHFKTISPRRFKYLIGQFEEQFITNEQQDSQELLLFLLDGLHEDLNKADRRRPPIEQDDLDKMPDLEASVASWKIHVSMNNSIIVDLFQGQFKSTVSCLTCGKKSVKFDAFMYLTLPIPSSRCTIYDCVELFMQPEKMSGEPMWKCPKCNQPREAVKKMDIWKLPQILIVHLKRFKNHGVWRDKLTTFVDYPLENLELDKYVYKSSPFANSNSPRPPNNYYLYGISNHSGTMDGGHYTSMCRHPVFNSWFKYDDSNVSSVGDSSSLKSSTSYILFYSRY